MDVNENNKTIKTEYRLSIYGRSKKEWDELAKWHLNYKLVSCKFTFNKSKQ
jgi:hypothetical protein